MEAPLRVEEREKGKPKKAGEGKRADIVTESKKTVVKPKAKRPTSEFGRKIGDTRTATMMRGITECRVELLSTLQKAKLPVPAAPNNSAESNSVAETAGAYDARLFLSATDLHVQVELPGEVTETTAETTSTAVPSGKATA